MRPGDQPPFRWEGLARPETLNEVRHAIKIWGTHAGLGAELLASVILAGYEAMANAAEHAYRDAELGPVAITIAATDNTLTATITDHGHWRQPTVGGSAAAVCCSSKAWSTSSPSPAAARAPRSG